MCVRHQLTCCSRCSLYDTPAPRPNAIKPQTARVRRTEPRTQRAGGSEKQGHTARTQHGTQTVTLTRYTGVYTRPLRTLTRYTGVGLGLGCIPIYRLWALVGLVGVSYLRYMVTILTYPRCVCFVVHGLLDYTPPPSKTCEHVSMRSLHSYRTGFHSTHDGIFVVAYGKLVSRASNRFGSDIR